LRDTVLVNLKILLAQVADEGALPAGHGGVQHHQIDVNRDVGARVIRGRRRLLKSRQECR